MAGVAWRILAMGSPVVGSSETNSFPEGSASQASGPVEAPLFTSSIPSLSRRDLCLSIAVVMEILLIWANFIMLYSRGEPAQGPWNRSSELLVDGAESLDQ